MSNIIECSICGHEIHRDVFQVEGQYICDNCYYEETFQCDCCKGRFLSNNAYGDDNIQICSGCYEDHYHRCVNCNTLVYSEDVYWVDGTPYCCECYDEYNNEDWIKDYYYKPSPNYHKCRDESQVRYYGVELEIDKGGKIEDNAEDICNIANRKSDVLYIKSDSSLDEGMELVSHPCTLKYHRNELPWVDIMKKAIQLDYCSHNTSTCGLHVHIGRAELGETVEQQDEVISRIMFFLESHWNEMYKFSRRSEYSIERWASRYGYKDKPKDILDKAKKNNVKGRYTCVNITNGSTVEIRIFKGTLKWNTFIATLELVDTICDNAVRLTDDEIHKQSWNDFVIAINPEYHELVKYLKEKRLYVNEPIENEEEV